jgi:hypothetical protein
MPTRLKISAYNRQQIQKLTGHFSQLGGVQLLTLADAASRGVRMLEFRTGSGLIFKVAIDRGMDIGSCEYQGISVAWMSPNGLPGPWFFDQTDSFGWFRTALGGLINTCGLLHIGDPEEDDISHYRFMGRQKITYGVHDRIALTPAKLISYGEFWEGDSFVLEAVGEITQAQAFGENLCLRRQYRTHLGATSFSLTDEVENIGHLPVTHMLLYHINLGFPLIDAGSRLVAPFTPGLRSQVLAGHTTFEDVERDYIIPHPEAELQVFQHMLTAEADKKVPVGVINSNLDLVFILCMIVQRYLFSLKHV